MGRSLLERLSALEKSVERTPPPSAKEDISPQNEAPTSSVNLSSLAFELKDEGCGPFYHRALHYDLLTVHGIRRYAELFRCDISSLERALKAPLKFENLRFYDTETTGLGTGAGTFPFLHAVAEFTEDELVLHQYFVEDFSHEYAVLEALMRRHFSGDVTVISFNGKSFDWPLLKSRLFMYRLNQYTAPLPHGDLLYPARRLWRQAIQSVTLSNVEHRILGMERIDDLPGKEAPNRYFQYTETRDPLLVEPVFSHNASDVCTLVTLTAVLADILAGKQPVDSSAAYVALASWYDEWREDDLAERCYEAATQMEDADFKAYWRRSMHHKRRADWPVATGLWTQMTEQFPWSVSPAVELAKHAEHRVKSYESAEQWTRFALARAEEGMRLRSRSTDADMGDPVIQTLRHRLARILTKLERQKGP